MKPILMKFSILLCLISCFFNFLTAQIKIDPTISFDFNGELLLKNDLKYKNELIGGLSSIDYVNGKYYSICDSSYPPIRFYEFDILFKENQLDTINVLNVFELKDEKGAAFKKNSVDPEALRFDTPNNTFIWTSEGNIKNKKNPQLFKFKVNTYKSTPINLPENLSDYKFFRHNGAYESLAIDYNNEGYWFASEYPLNYDGKPPTFSENNSPVRISLWNTEENKCTNQFAFHLEKVAIEPKNNGKANNGLVALLSINDNEFLSLERSYTLGEKNNVIKLFLLSNENATDVSKISSLKNNTNYNPLNKKLIFNFKSILEKLPSQQVDNIEGMCFGPKLENGKQSILFISDNNFNKYGNQTTQIIALSF